MEHIYLQVLLISRQINGQITVCFGFRFCVHANASRTHKSPKFAVLPLKNPPKCGNNSTIQCMHEWELSKLFDGATLWFHHRKHVANAIVILGGISFEWVESTGRRIGQGIWTL
jgi:hypothetical protein